MNRPRVLSTAKRQAWPVAPRHGAVVCAALLLAGGAAADWPTFMHDAQRSGITTEALATNLAPAWVYPRARQPTPAWPDEAKKDASVSPAEQRPFKARILFDHVPDVAIAGGLVYFGSAADHSILCLDALTGEPQWRFFTEAPVRLAPTVAGDRVYVGSDDGSVYCLEGRRGALVWQDTPAGTLNYYVPNNGQLASPWAVRTGVLVEGGVAYFGAGLFPSEGVYLCAVDAATGRRTTASHWQTRHVNQGSMQGYLLLSNTRVYVPSGRSNPWFYDRRTGALLGQYHDREAAGTFALLAGNSLFFGRAGRTDGRITEAGPAGDVLATYAHGNAIVVTANRSYLLSETALTALDRATRRALWSKPVSDSHTLILAGQTLFAALGNQVAAFSADTGTKLWTGPVEGRALGLAVAANRLFVSTDEGLIYAFAEAFAPDTNALIIR